MLFYTEDKALNKKTRPWIRTYTSWKNTVHRGYWPNYDFLRGGTPVWCPRSRGISTPSSTKLPH